MVFNNVNDLLRRRFRPHVHLLARHELPFQRQLSRIHAKLLPTIFLGSMRSCYPPSFSYQPDLFATDGYVYSPGVCPSGYYAAKSNGAHAKKDGGGAKTSWCCPTSFTFSAFQGCVSVAHPKTVTTLYQFGVPVQVQNPYVVLEPYVPVTWASSDLAVFNPTSAPLSNKVNCVRTVASSSGVARLIDESGTAGVINDSKARAGGGLSTAAKAGVGVGVATAAIMAIVMAVLLLTYRRKALVSTGELKMRKQGQVETVELKHGISLSEVDSSSRFEADRENHRAEADPANGLRSELDENVVRAKVEGGDLRHELDSGWRGHEIPTSNVNNEKG